MAGILDRFIIGPLTGEHETERYVISINAPADDVFNVITSYGALRSALGVGQVEDRGGMVSASRLGYRFTFPDREGMEKGDEIVLQPLFPGLVVGLKVAKVDEGHRLRLRYVEGPLAGKLTWNLDPDPDSEERTLLQFVVNCSIEDPWFRILWTFFFQWIHYFVIGLMLLEIRRASESAQGKSQASDVIA